MSESRDYAAIALQYAIDVVLGSIAACKWVVAASQRQLDDLARAETADFPFRYEPARGAKVCRLIELLPHIKGKWKTKTIRLEAWQIFIVMTVFSWVWATAAHADEEIREKNGLRRFRTVDIEVPRKNAKSTLTAGVGLYMVAPDGEQGAECYSAATTRDQARIVSNVAQAMARRTPAYREYFGVEVNAHSITVPDTESIFKALSADDDSLDGLNPHFVSVDELHAHKTRGVWDVLETATGARDQSLLWAITTAGSNRAGICYEVRTYLTQILTAALKRHTELSDARGYKIDGGAVDDETFFGVIYTIDDGDDWTDPAVWAKANPNLGVSVKKDDLARKCLKAQQLPSAVPNFLTKHLDVWINADSAWMDMRQWDACGDQSLRIEDFAGEECIVAVDIASNIDIAATVRVFRRSIDEAKNAGEFGESEPRTHYYAFGRFYVPEEVAEESDNSQYTGWIDDGRLIATDGNVIDQNEIQDDLRADKELYQIREIAYDPFQATKFALELQDDGFTMVEMGATVKNFSAPMKSIEALVRARRFHHDGDPAFAWMISNIVAHVDKKDNVFPNKQTAKNKIDGGVALIMAIGRWETGEPPQGPSVYETQGVEFLS
jgi:phage terminase large subunit-like protein